MLILLMKQKLKFYSFKYIAFDFSSLILALDHTIANRLHKEFLQWRYHTLAYCRWWIINIHKFYRNVLLFWDFFSFLSKVQFWLIFFDFHSGAHPPQHILQLMLHIRISNSSTLLMIMIISFWTTSSSKYFTISVTCQDIVLFDISDDR